MATILPIRSRRSGTRRASTMTIGVSAARKSHSLLEKMTFGHETRVLPARRGCRYASSALRIAGTRAADAISAARGAGMREDGFLGRAGVATRKLYRLGQPLSIRVRRSVRG